MNSPFRVEVQQKTSRPPSVESLNLNEVLTEVIPLLESAESPSAFFRPYLEKVKRITQAIASAVWLRTPRGSFERAFDCDWEEILSSESSRAAHQFLLEDAAAQGRTIWLSLPTHSLVENVPATPSHASLPPASQAFLFAPILVERKLVGLLEVVLLPPADRELKRFLTRTTTELAGIAAAFVHKREWVQLQEHHALYQNLDAFALKIHQSLVPTEVAFYLAQEGKKLTGCHQLSVGIRQGRSTRVASISGASGPEKNSPLVRAMADLLHHVTDWGETLVYEGKRDETLPPLVAQALDRHLANSNALVLIVHPLTVPQVGTVGALLAESFENALPAEKVRARLEAIAGHGAPALANALTHDNLPLKWLSRPLGQQNGKSGILSSRWTLVFIATCVVVLLLSLIQLPRRMEATGQLVPRERRIVYSVRNGKVVHLAVKHGDQVEKGQELLFLEDLETQLKVDQLLVKMGSLDQKLAFLDEQLVKNLPPRERSDLFAERIKSSYEMNKAKVERDLLLSEVRNPRKAAISAPMSGRVITFDPGEKLSGKTVKVGDPLLRVAEVDGPWEVELFLPERNIGPIREALATAESLEVQLLVSSDPHRTYTGILTGDGLGGETVTREDKVVLPVRVAIKDRSLINQLTRMPVGVEVQARIDCGRASAGFVWFNEAWDFLYRRFLF